MERRPVFYVDSLECICPTYRNEIIGYCRHYFYNNMSFAIVIDPDDHIGNGIIEIHDVDDLVKILDGYANLHSSYTCNCLMCSVNRELITHSA